MPTTSPFNTAKTRVGTSFRRFSSLLLGLFFLSALSTLATPYTAHADTDSDRELLELYYDPQDLNVTTATRSPKPLSRSAESITVVTAEQIEAMNAHTLADVLNTVPGVQLDLRGAPGSGAAFALQGSLTNHILVMIDGIPVNDLLNNYPLVGQIPVQNIERVEIVKSPASSSWGSALGGVISVITKEPSKATLPSGSASFSGGENGTRDSRGELTGTVGNLGYYFSGANQRSNGFRANNATENNNLYAKLRWDIPERGNVRLALNYRNAIIGEGDLDLTDSSNNFKTSHFYTALALDYNLTDRLTLNSLFKTTRYDYNKRRDFLGIDPTFSKGDPLERIETDENTTGGALQLTWRQGLHTVTGGIDFDHGKTDTDVLYPLFPDFNQKIFATNDRWGFFLNDTIAWERFTITPAFRYDLTSRTGDHFSPSLGVTFNLTDKTLLRSYIARGYSLPCLAPQWFAQEKGWTVQAGLETTEIPGLWIKGTWFRNATSNIPTFSGTLEKQLREGFEIETRTVPIYNTWLTAGYVFINGENRTLNTGIKDEARHTVDLGLHYDDRTFRGALTGHYIAWDATPIYKTQDNHFIWDLNLGWKAYKGRNAEAEVFFTGHNLFNSKQYWAEVYNNPDRWFEGGLRIKW